MKKLGSVSMHTYCMYVDVDLYLYTYMYMLVLGSLCISIYIYIHVYVCMYVCMYVCVNTHTRYNNCSREPQGTVFRPV